MARILHRNLKAYLEGGGTACPACSSPNLHFAEPNLGDGTATCDASCTACGRTWREAYELVGVDVDGRGFYRLEEHLSDIELVQRAMHLLDGIQWKGRRGEHVDAARGQLQAALDRT